MKKSIFYFLALYLLPTAIINAQEFCLTDDFAPASSMAMNAAICAAANSGSSNYGNVSLRVYVHVIRNASGNGGYTYDEVVDAVEVLDNDFNPHGIYFAWDGCIDYIDDNSFYNSTTNGIFNVNNNYDGIDMYLFPVTHPSTGGRANGVGNSSEFWVAGTWPGAGPTALNRVISHEMGHVLFLWHTHHGCESGGIWELTDGSNCDTAGDFVCDTPADPHMSFNVDANCEWTGQNSFFCNPPEPLSAYNPDESVIMAYTDPNCMSYFTTGQGNRMQESIATLAYLQACIASNVAGDACCGDYTLINGNVDDLTALLGLSDPYDLLTADSDVMIEGAFTVDKDIQLTDGVNFYMSEGSQIEVQEDVLFRKVGGFIEPCEIDEWNHIRSNGGKYYLYEVKISGASNAIICNGGTGDVIGCDIDDCHVGIRMFGSNGLFISHNDIDVEHTGIMATSASAFVAQTNTVGASSPVVRGIKLDNASDGLLYFNSIFSEYRGIESNYSLAGMGLNTINNDGNAGISSFESSVFINDNTIDGTGGSGIYFNTNADGNASHNRVSGDFYRMVQMQATQDHMIYANEISGGGDNGIFNTNSGFNYYECNDLTGPDDYGIYNGGNSILQEFITNEFSGSAGEDFYSTSEFGPQVLTGNESWCEAHATGFTPGFSGFWVSDDTPDCTETPANFTPQLFLPDQSGDSPLSCGSSPGPGGVPSPEFICWWIEYLSNLPPDRRNFYWVNSYHLIKRFKNNIPESEWPECIWILPIDCGLEELAEAEVEYMNALSETSNEIKSIRYQYNATISSEDRFDNEAYVHALSQARIAKEQTLKDLRAQQIARLSLLPCDDQMSELYRTVFILRLKNQDEKLNESDLSYLRQVAGMCASEYGDVVHWAMGLLSSYTSELPVAVDECSDRALEGRSRTIIKDKIISSSVFPNPVSTELTVALNGVSEGQLTLSAITGQTILITNLIEGDNIINVETLNAGIYLLKIIADDYDTIEKITVTK